MSVAYNPVYKAELKHQRYVISSSRAGRLWILLALLLLVPALLASVVYTLKVFVGRDFLFSMSSGTMELLGATLVIMNIALYFVVSLITMGLAASSIQREIDGHTWETLLLTGITPRQIILGKWRATLLALWGDYILLLVLRLGFVALMALSLTDLYAGDVLDMGLFLVTLGLAVVFTILDALLSAALGLITPLTGLGNVLLLPVLLGRLLLVAVLAFAIGAIANALPAVPLRGAAAALIVAGLAALLTWLFLYLAEHATSLYAVLQPLR